MRPKGRSFPYVAWLPGSKSPGLAPRVLERPGMTVEKREVYADRLFRRRYQPRVLEAIVPSDAETDSGRGEITISVHPNRLI